MIATLPLTTGTRHLLNADRFALMKPSAYFINIGRGPTVDQSALTAALTEGRLAGAALDVFEHEPIDPADPLLTMDNVIVTPHAIGLTRQMLADVGRSACRSVLAVAEGRVPASIINPEALEHPTAAFARPLTSIRRRPLRQSGAPVRRPANNCTPSASARSFAHTIEGWTRLMKGDWAKPQSVDASTRSGPTIAGEAFEPVSDQLRVLDHIRRVTDQSRRELSIGRQVDVPPHLPLVLVAGIRGLEQVRAGVHPQDEIDDLGERNVTRVRAVPAAPAQVIANPLGRQAP